MNTTLLKQWFGQAFTIAVNGLIHGAPAGGIGGTAVGAGMTSAGFSWRVAALAATAAAVAATAFAAHEVIIWAREHPFPNIFANDSATKTP